MTDFAQIIGSDGRVASYVEFEKSTQDGPKVIVSGRVEVEVVAG